MKEEFILKLKLNRIYYFFIILYFFIFLLSFFKKNITMSIFIFLFIILFIEIMILTENYYFYKDKIIYNFKFISFHKKLFIIKKFKIFSLKQNILERIFNDNFYVNTASFNKIELTLKSIKNPKII